MKRVKEVYENSKGEKVYLDRFIGKKEQCILYTDKEYISPIVGHIEYDSEHELFLAIDDYQEIDLNGHVGINSANVFFYIDFDGNPVGLAYTDAFDGMFTPTLKSEDNPHHDKWFLEYGVFKHNLGVELGRTIARRTNHYGECAKKMLSVYKK